MEDICYQFSINVIYIIYSQISGGRIIQHAEKTAEMWINLKKKSSYTKETAKFWSCIAVFKEVGQGSASHYSRFKVLN